MKAATYKINPDGSWNEFSKEPLKNQEVELLFCFGEKSKLVNQATLDLLKGKFPKADIILGSSSGEIFQEEVNDHTLSLLALQFESTTHKSLVFNQKDYQNDYELGKTLYKELEAPNLAYIHILSDGLEIHKGDLLKGLNENNQTVITGGMAGDSDSFTSTCVGLNNTPKSGNVVGVGFYGENFKVAYGSFGGWEEFGLSRKVTRSEYNTLYEVDGQNILDLYKKYLGPFAKELPISAIMFPLSLENPKTQEKVVRTVLGINEDEKSIRFGGDIPEGWVIRLMKSNTDDIVDAARSAALSAHDKIKDVHAYKAAIFVSCVGRKIVLDKRVAEEIEEMQEVLGNDVAIAGYYSYGEISPLKEGGECKLHNQTMTLTLFDEIS